MITFYFLLGGYLFGVLWGLFWGWIFGQSTAKADLEPKPIEHRVFFVPVTLEAPEEAPKREPGQKWEWV